MDYKYEVIKVEEINENTKLYTINDTITNEEYSCVVETIPNKKSNVSMDEKANKFDVAYALFQYDLDILPELPLDMIGFDVYREYEDYHPGKGRCQFDSSLEFEEAYIEEEQRINSIRKNNKQLIK